MQSKVVYIYLYKYKHGSTKPRFGQYIMLFKQSLQHNGINELFNNNVYLKRGL